MTAQPKRLDKEQIEKILKIDCQFFTGLTIDELDMYLSHPGVNLLLYAKDFPIRHQRSAQSDFGILVSGEAEIRQYDEQGNIFTVDMIEAGDMFGEMTAFSKPAFWPASVVSATDCLILFIPIDRVQYMKDEQHPDIALRLSSNMLELIASKTLNLRSRIEILTKNAMRDRIAVFLMQQARAIGKESFTVAMNREGMARYLNVSRPSMSRELGRMKEEGLIDFYKNSFNILDMNALKQLVST